MGGRIAISTEEALELEAGALLLDTTEDLLLDAGALLELLETGVLLGAAEDLLLETEELEAGALDATDEVAPTMP